MEWNTQGLPPPLWKFKKTSVAGKAMATVFWDCHGVIVVDFLEKRDMLSTMNITPTNCAGCVMQSSNRSEGDWPKVWCCSFRTTTLHTHTAQLLVVTAANFSRTSPAHWILPRPIPVSVSWRSSTRNWIWEWQSCDGYRRGLTGGARWGVQPNGQSQARGPMVEMHRQKMGMLLRNKVILGISCYILSHVSNDLAKFQKMLLRNFDWKFIFIILKRPATALHVCIDVVLCIWWPVNLFSLYLSLPSLLLLLFEKCRNRWSWMHDEKLLHLRNFWFFYFFFPVLRKIL